MLYPRSFLVRLIFYYLNSLNWISKQIFNLTFSGYDLMKIDLDVCCSGQCVGNYLSFNVRCADYIVSNYRICQVHEKQNNTTQNKSKQNGVKDHCTKHKTLVHAFAQYVAILFWWFYVFIFYWIFSYKAVIMPAGKELRNVSIKKRKCWNVTLHGSVVKIHSLTNM